jgi:hypothetical protein
MSTMRSNLATPFLLLSLVSLLVADTDSFSIQRMSRSRDLSLRLESDRRLAVARLIGVASSMLLPRPSRAGEIGARITQAVTTSELGVSVRKSIVKGAQTMDLVDRRWEEFSDKFALGSERSKQVGRPTAKTIPPLLALDTVTANKILEACDEAFCAVTGVPNSIVKKECDKVTALVQPSFQRSGVDLASYDSVVASGMQFNFASYVHFKAYSNLLLDRNIEYRKFRRDFEKSCGTKLLALLSIDPPAPMSSKASDALDVRLRAVDALTRALRDKGLVAATEVSSIDPDRLADWEADLSDLQLSLALDGDITQNAQILLQEQGFNLIPSYTKFMLEQLLEMPGQNLSIEEYYMDTDYNSNPDLFEVKEVLLNIVLESK